MRLRKVIFWCHLGAGIVIGSVLLMMSVTGALMAFEPQVTAFAERHVRDVNPPAGAQKLNLQTLIDKARQANPEPAISVVSLRAGRTASVAINFGREKVMYFDPYNGMVLGTGSKIHEWRRQIEQFHRTLGANENGKIVTHACCAGFFFMVLSGFYLWWPRKWQWSLFESRLFFSPNLKGKARNWNWHNVIGFWCLPLLLVTTLTGLVMSYAWANNLLFRLSGSELPVISKKMGGTEKKEEGRERMKEGASVSLVPAFDFEKLQANAEKQVPGWVSMNIRLPQSPEAPVMIYIQEPGLPSFSRSPLTLDSKTAEVLKWEPYSSQNLGRRLRLWVRPLHTGEAWGFPSQVAAFLAAAGTFMLIWTGFAMALRRLLNVFLNKPDMARAAA